MYNMEELTEKVHQLKELERQKDDIETKISILKEYIQEIMTAEGVTELVGDDWKVTWSTVESRRFDQSGFKASHPDLFEEFRVLSESRRFTVK